MDFPTMYSKDNSNQFSEPGSPVLQEYEYSLDNTGHKMLTKKDSFIDVYERIQADADSVDINVLMERFALGDTEAINIRKGEFIDARDFPKTYAEVFQRGLECEQYFDSLPVDLKKMFDNSYSVFFEEMGSKSFDDKVNEYNDRFVDHRYDIKDDEPKNNEVNEVNYNE